MEVTTQVPDIGAAVGEAESVRVATREEIPQVADALARGFGDDPIVSWLLPDEATRVPTLVRGFSLFLRREYMKFGLTYTTANHVGASVWAPPGGWKTSIFHQLMLMPAMIAIYKRRVPAVMRVLNAMEKNHPHDDHYYLPFVAVVPEWRGRGLGTALMQPAVGRADEEGLPCYLESTNPRNRACYERQGFRIVKEIEPGGGCPPLTAMRREPGATA